MDIDVAIVSSTPTPIQTIVSTPPQRPSSPRQFFERLYGHLETRTHNSENSDIDVGTTHIETAYQSDGGSVSSPDISISDKQRVSMANFPAYDLYTAPPEYNTHHRGITTGSTPAALPFPGFPSEAHINAGFSAFLARRRRKEGRQRRQRTTFSTEQTLRLEVEFHRNEYISRSRRFELAETLRLTEIQIKIWFQNRRAKDKRIEKAQIDQHYRNFVVANGFMSTIMGQTSYATSAPVGVGVGYYAAPPPPALQTLLPATMLKDNGEALVNNLSHKDDGYLDSEEQQQQQHRVDSSVQQRRRYVPQQTLVDSC